MKKKKSQTKAWKRKKVVATRMEGQARQRMRAARVVFRVSTVTSGRATFPCWHFYVATVNGTDRHYQYWPTNGRWIADCGSIRSGIVRSPEDMLDLITTDAHKEQTEICWSTYLGT